MVNGQEYTDFPNHLNDFLTAVANLNKVYNQFNIFFKYKGYDTFVTPTAQWNANFDETGYYVIETIGEYSQLWQYTANQGYVEPNSFNVYAYGWGFAGGAVHGQKVLYLLFLLLADYYAGQWCMKLGTIWIYSI